MTNYSKWSHKIYPWLHPSHPPLLCSHIITNTPPYLPPCYLNVSISIGLINTSLFRCLCVCLCLNRLLGCGEREEGWCIGMISALLFFFFWFSIIYESLSLSLCLWSIIISLPSLILSFHFFLIHHCCVCVCVWLWIMQWPFHWHGPAWPSLDTTELNRIHHNNICLLPSQTGKHTFVCLSVYNRNASVYRWGYVERKLQSADAGKRRGGGGLDRQCEKTTRLFRSLRS